MSKKQRLRNALLSLVMMTGGMQAHAEQVTLAAWVDCMAVSGCAGIAVGRLASLFNSSDRGQVIENLKTLPFVYPVTNAVSGALEYRLATFMIQSMVALLLFAGLSAYYLSKDPKGRRKDGDTALIFLLIYGASQVVLDSTRYDSLFFRSNGFVSVVQVLGGRSSWFGIAYEKNQLSEFQGIKFPWKPTLSGSIEYHGPPSCGATGTP